MSLENLIAKSTGLRKSFILRVIKRAPHSYKTYSIPKRTGGLRTIHHPSAELKILQRWVAKHIFERLPIHECVYSYRDGRNIRQHALVHRRNNFLLRLDLQDFFPSIKARDIENLLSRYGKHFSFPLDESDLHAICQITCRKSENTNVYLAPNDALCLTIGAPSSPAISNVILFDIDSTIAKICNDIGVTYTRYADDLYFSTNERDVLSDLATTVRRIIEGQRSPRLRINADKTVFTSSKRRKVITGLVISSEKKISLGREKKRYFRSLIFKYCRNELPPEEVGRLRGLLNFAFQVDSAFAISVIDKYGVDTFTRLQIGNLDRYIL